MKIIGTLAALALIGVTLVDAFETILQPRRVTHRFRYARLFYRSTWTVWRGVARVIPAGKKREAFLSVFGPLSLLGLFATWVIGLIFGFALLQWASGTPLKAPHDSPGFWAYIYLSGTTFFTLGYGDVTPTSPLGHALGIVESGLGFGFLAVIISYLPALYQAFSRREVTISMLDARAGSPPSAGQFLLRLARSGRIAEADPFLSEWEQWSAELLESNLSFPVLAYYRSQHDNQSWLAALTMILDTCALLIVHVKRADSYHPQITFAMARHAAVDLALVLRARPRPPAESRLPVEQLQTLRTLLAEAGVELHDHDDAGEKLAELRRMYEPFINAMAARFLFVVPGVMGEEPTVDNWQRSAWMKRVPGIGSLPAARSDGEHF